MIKGHKFTKINLVEDWSPVDQAASFAAMVVVFFFFFLS